MLNIVGGETETDIEIIRTTPFFASYKIYSSLALVVLFGGIFEKSQSTKLDNNLFVKLIFCIVSLGFLFAAHWNWPAPTISVKHDWWYYLVNTLAGIFLISLYVGLLTKEK